MFGAARSFLTVIVLVAVNLVPLVGVLFFGWSLFTILFLYWIENGIVGLVNIFKIGFAAKPASSESNVKLTMNGSNVTSYGKVFLIPFFIVHYGIFWVVHGVFVIVLFGLLGGSFDSPTFGSGFEDFNVRGAVIAALGMLLSHVFSFFYNFIGRKEYLNVTPSEQMFEPYSRVMALHVTILGGGFLASYLGTPLASLVILVVVKTGIDVVAHLREHAKAQSGATQESAA